MFSYAFKELLEGVFLPGDLELSLTEDFVLLFSVPDFMKDSPDRRTMLKTGLWRKGII